MKIMLGKRKLILIGTTVALVGQGFSGTHARGGSCVPPQSEAIPGWTEIPAPEFPATDDEDVPVFGDRFDTYKHIWSYAIDPVDPSTIYVTNRTTVMKSDDGGCAWEQVYTTRLAEGQPCRVQTCWPRITRISIPHSAEGHQRVYLTLDIGPDRQIIVTDNGFQTTRRADSGLPKGLTWKDPVIAPSDAKVMYLVAEGLCGANRWLYRSGDAGVSWQRVTDVLRLPNNPQCVELYSEGPPPSIVVDPLDASELWGWGAGENLFHSTDGGKQWERIESPLYRVDVLQLTRNGRRPAGLWVLGVVVDKKASVPVLENDTYVPAIYRSRDKGKTWEQIESPRGIGGFVPFLDAKGGREGGSLLAIARVAEVQTTVPQVLLRFSSRSREWTDITPVTDYYCNFSSCQVSDLTTDLAKPTGFYVAMRASFLGSAIWKYTGPTS